jgi:hypothetical protein
LGEEKQKSEHGKMEHGFWGISNSVTFSLAFLTSCFYDGYVGEFSYGGKVLLAYRICSLSSRARYKGCLHTDDTPVVVYLFFFFLFLRGHVLFLSLFFTKLCFMTLPF